MIQKDIIASKVVSSTFELQLTELLVELTPHQFVQEKCEKLFNRISQALKSAKLKQSLPIQNIAYWDKFKITFPLTYMQNFMTEALSGIEYKYVPCEEIVSSTVEVCGGKPVLKAYLDIPKSVFGEKCFMNLQYSLKRAHYMCSCISILKKKSNNLSFSFVPGAQEDLLFPNLLITGDDVSVLLIFTASQLVGLERFALSIGNFRPSVLIGPDAAKRDAVPTPRYNQRVLRTMLELSLIQEIQSAILKHPSLKEALILLKVWFKCRDLHVFDDLFLGAYMLHLLNKSVISELQQAINIFKNVLFSLEEWDVGGVVSLKSEEDPKAPSSEYLSAFDVVLLDRTGKWNLAHAVTFDHLNKAKISIVESIPYVGEFHYFEKLFRLEDNFETSHDEYFKLYLSSSNFENILKNHVFDVVDWKDRLNAFTSSFQKMLRSAMGERYEHVMFSFDYENTSWGLNENKSTMPVDIVILIGFKVKKQWRNPLTVGPIANEPSAKDFRSFWGKSSELRRFSDTRICECVVWGTESSDQIVFSILKFIVKEKFNLLESNLSWLSEIPQSLKSDKAAYDKLGVAFASLNRVLRGMKSLPLEVSNIHGMSSYLRSAEPFASDLLTTPRGRIQANARVPNQNLIPKFRPAVKVFVRLVLSSKWGNEMEAVRHLTTAYYIKMAEQLREMNYASVGTEEGLMVHLENIVFKIILVNDKYQSILGRQKKELIASLAPRVETTEVSKQLKKVERIYLSEPNLSASIHSFSKRFDVFPDTVQITKLWLASHLLSSFIDNYAIEMIVCAAIKDLSLNVPLSPWAAFRKVLQLLSTHPWVSSPLIIDFDDAWKEDDVAKLQRNFLKLRPVLPPMVIMTNQDEGGTKWTFDGPSPVILNRITALAKICYNEINGSFQNVQKIDIMETLMRPNTSGYDAVVRFHKKVLSRNLENSKTDGRKALPVVDFDPFESFALHLRSLLERVALVFYNKYGGCEVYIKFKPQTERMEFSVSKCAFHKMEGDYLVLNKEEVFETIKVIGKGIVSDVVVLN